VARLWALRSKLTKEQGQSLFVRLVTTDTSDSEQVLEDFASREVIPRVNDLIQSGAHSGS